MQTGEDCGLSLGTISRGGGIQLVAEYAASETRNYTGQCGRFRDNGPKLAAWLVGTGLNEVADWEKQLKNGL